MKNQKGFTMVELMAVIVVIGIIALIAIPVYHGTSERMKQKAYENKVSDIETKAESFAESTNRLLISVQDLVDAGKLEADNEEGDILSPIDNERMNCYIIETVLKDGSYESTLTDENNCNKADDLARNIDLDLVVRRGSTTIDPANWQGQDVTLEARFVRNADQYENIKYQWLHINEEISGETRSTYQTRTETITNNIFTVKVNATKGGEEVTLTKSVRIKIDKQAPSVDEVNSKVIDGDKWGGPEKTIQIKGIDYDGSGIASYYIGSKVSNCSSVSYTTTQTKSYGQGIYSLCVKDQVGNVSKPYDVLVDKIDSGRPTATIQVINNDIWTNTSKQVVVGGIDHESGIKGYYLTTSSGTCSTNASSYNKTTTYLKGLGTYYACAMDNAGNVSETPASATVKMIDTTPPVVTAVVREGDAWTNTDKHIDITVADSGSGIPANAYYLGTSSTCPTDLSLYTSTSTYVKDMGYYYACGVDNVGNITRYGTYVSNYYIDKTPPYTPRLYSEWLDDNPYVRSWSCEKNESYSYTDNICTIRGWSDGSYFYFYRDHDDDRSGVKGYYYAVTYSYPSGNLSGSYYSRGNGTPLQYGDVYQIYWSVDNAGNVGPGRLIVRTIG